MPRHSATPVILRLLPALALGLACTTLTCERPTAPANANAAPHTRLGNIPKDNDTVFALATMYWDAGDFDGYITGFQYRYVTYHFTGSSWLPYDSTAWKDTVGATVTIPFNSTDVLNKQVFYVRAVDNDGAADPQPATKTLYTTRTTPPISRLLAPGKGASLLVAQQITDWWNGVTITFTAKDQATQGGIEQYAWSVDGSPWHWTERHHGLPPPVGLPGPPQRPA